ncbi:hypothetical protein JJB11_09635 [Ramlibacter ginsenosidimutans]|uniref:Uncharacterized protein n=1 Tax=Ramlibacter ginsenosidimutans TaxID=502333 RepID=A0A934WM75_9BURK|nr:hypothetical protein [Ramlibacter ginsenosidimutans]MBK6006351.1 hypothetical protein [Ramlibacter ginsenosidimutans]
MLGIGLPHPGEVLLALVGACLVLALLLKATAFALRRFGVPYVAEGRIWHLWMLIVGSLLLAAAVGFGSFLAGGTMSLLLFKLAFVFGVFATAFAVLCPSEVRHPNPFAAAGLAGAITIWALSVGAALLLLILPKN